MTIRSTASVVGQKMGAVAVTISPWVNEPMPDLQGILCSHDLARLTRRPRWMLHGLALIGKFPRKRRYGGRAVGWCRAEVLEWMMRGITVEKESDECLNALRHRAPQDPRQTCLPLEYRPPWAGSRNSR